MGGTAYSGSVPRASQEAALPIEFTDRAVARPSHFLYFDSFDGPARGGPSHFSLHAFAGAGGS